MSKVLSTREPKQQRSRETLERLLRATIKVLDRKQEIFGIGGVAILVVVISFVYDGAQQKKQNVIDAQALIEANAPFDPYAGGFPVPPMPGQHLPSRRPVAAAVRATSSRRGATAGDASVTDTSDEVTDV